MRWRGEGGVGASVLCLILALTPFGTSLHSLYLQEESAQRRETLRLETEVELRRQRMDLEREMDAEKLKVSLPVDPHPPLRASWGRGEGITTLGGMSHAPL